LPRDVPVMILPDATLFPQALLPLYIFEPRYRQMLADALDSNRMFAVAMQKPGTTREMPSPIAGLGLIRVSVRHKNETSHLVVQGLARVELEQTLRYKPYRVQRIRPLETPPCDSVTVDALLAKVKELLKERIHLGAVATKHLTKFEKQNPAPSFSPREMLKYLDSLTDPEQTVDLISWSLLPGGQERQEILETLDVENRLRRLIHFLLIDIHKQRKGGA